MKRKVLDICLDGFHLECIRINREGENNPFRVYKVSSGHKRQIAKYGDFLSVVCFIRDLYTDGADTFSTPQIVEWAKARGNIY